MPILGAKTGWAVILILLFSLSAKAESTAFLGKIEMVTPSGDTQNYVVNLVVSNIAPANGTLENKSHVLTDQNMPTPHAVCEYHYNFPAATAVINIKKDDGTEIGYATTDAAVSGVVYTDAPANNDIGLCRPPRLDQFPITGHLDVAVSPFKDFALPGGALLAFDVQSDPFGNEAVIALNNNNGTKPVLSRLTLSSAKPLHWRTFGTKDPSLSGNVELKPVKTM